MRATGWAFGAVAVSLLGCMSAERAAEPLQGAPSAAPAFEEGLGASDEKSADAAPEARRRAPARSAAAGPPAEGERKAEANLVGALKGDADRSGSDDSVRQWFPEAFLWRPLVETDASGRATVEVRVPDQLTTWRVLALAHDRAGRQSGTVQTFDSRLPLYADPVVPAWLYVGDTLDLAVTVTNGTANGATGSLAVLAEGALGGGGRGALSLPPGGAAVERVPLRAVGAGAGWVTASVTGAGAEDTVRREIRVLPVGRPVRVERGGAFSATRTLTLDGPDGADPATRQVEVRVFGGAMSVFGAELERLGAVGAPDGGYALALAQRLAAPPPGVVVDPAVVRRLRLVAWQRVVRAARAPDAAGAADLLVGLRQVTDDPAAAALTTRLEATVAQGQRGDGTWSRSARAPLQQVIAETAWVAAALPEGAASRARAAGALERFAPEVTDPYTAALVLATGLVRGPRADALREILRQGLVERPDGGRTLPTPPGVRDPWGLPPARAAVLAAGAEALADDPAGGELLGELLAGWSAVWGFGAGPADARCLDAVSRILPALAAPVSVRLSIDGVVAGQGQLDPNQPMVPVRFSARPGGPDPEITLQAEPSVAGLGFSAALVSYVPWTGDERLPGVEVETALSPLEVGRGGTLTLTLSAPSGEVVVVDQGIGPGVVVDRAAVQLPPGATLAVLGDRVRITSAVFGAGDRQVVQIPVLPSIPGRFSTAPQRVQAGGREVVRPPARWVVAEEGSGV
jgi:hypothetical protein